MSQQGLGPVPLHLTVPLAVRLSCREQLTVSGLVHPRAGKLRKRSFMLASWKTQETEAPSQCGRETEEIAQVLERAQRPDPSPEDVLPVCSDSNSQSLRAEVRPRSWLPAGAQLRPHLARLSL